MNYDEETIYRNEILSRARSGKKLIPEEQLWLASHRIINQNLGYPYLNKDIVQLEPNTVYSVHVNVEHLAYTDRIVPVITVPAGKGVIITEGNLVDHNQKTTFKKSVKMLGILINSEHSGMDFYYQSNLGLLGVSYECDFYDELQRLKIRKNSGSPSLDFAMLREDLSKNKIVYRCKNPTNDDFDSLVFSLEWNTV